jgi:hypothetical protein
MTSGGSDMPLKGFQGQPNRPERARQVWETLCTLRDEPPEVITFSRADRHRLKLSGLIKDGGKSGIELKQLLAVLTYAGLRD